MSPGPAETRSQPRVESMSDFPLSLEPADKVVYKAKKLGEEPCTVQLKLTNPKTERFVFKIKCTSNEMFRIRPPVGALKNGESCNVSVSAKGWCGEPGRRTGRDYVHLECSWTIAQYPDMF